KQYKTYAPFTLFADACNVDAEDAIYFSSLCYNYISNKDASLKNEILAYLKSWIAIEKELEILQKNAPLITRVLPYAKRLANISIILEIGLLEENLNENQYRQIVTLLEQKEDPDVNLDVELAVTEALKDLSGFLLKK
ncbi:MAG: beta-N-acetylhexosaminidase, partial [Flavobacteriaceae bacterium]|nr:beta-N-acetylhexosaminidase [Flavobacteriaceae bacterium]